MAANFADVAEGVRATVAAYAQALDDGRIEELLETFCPDATCRIPGLGTRQGTEALREAFSGLKRQRRQRHLVVNTLVTQWGGTEAKAVSDLVVLVQEESGWKVEIVGRYLDTLRLHDGRWRFHERVAEFVR